MNTENLSKRIRWLHLSDIHTGKDNYAQRKIFTNILKHVEEQINNGFVPDLLFITGDIANEGKTQEYSDFSSELLLPLCKLIGSNIDENAFIIPGNHDVIQDINEFYPRKKILNPNSKFFDTDKNGLTSRSQFFPRFNSYINNFNIIPRDWINTEKGAYSRVISLKNLNLGIVGINTAWISGKRDEEGDDRHNLSPGIEILSNALQEVRDCDIKIVLGHHPVDWFADEHVQPIRKILGEYHALYLHGHQHKLRTSIEDGDGDNYLSVQCGAAFQTRQDDIWVNGLLWSEVDINRQVLRLHPREWNYSNRNWAVSNHLPESRRVKSSDWWEFPLPRSGKDNFTPISTPLFRYPQGWQPIDLSFLDHHSDSLGKDQILRFFDGAVPYWRTAISSWIPRFEIVEKVKKQITEYLPTNKPQVTLLFGPASEGKSTALMQIVEKILLTEETKYKILWRASEDVKLNPNEVLSLPQDGSFWLLVSDMASFISEDLYKTCELLHQHSRNDIQFLLATRDTDWQSSGAHRLLWITCSDFQKQTVSGLNENDAYLVVDSWLTLGDEAMGKLAGNDRDTSHSQLVKAATHEAKVKGGSLLGALLKVRYGDDLSEHVKLLLHRLDKRPKSGGIDLVRALGYIAAMHAENLSYMSRPILAAALGCPITKIHSLVLAPLGLEAAISDDGDIIFTRHLEIAKTVIKLLNEIYEEDVDEYYIELAKLAHKMKLENPKIYIPRFSGWITGLSKHFFDKNKKELAIRIGQELSIQEPTNLSLLINLARFYRESQHTGSASQLFREYPKEINQRAAFTEWGVCECISGNLIFGISLVLYSLSDQINISPPVKDYLKIPLGALISHFFEMYTKYEEPFFREACNSIARLGQIVPLNDETRNKFLKISPHAEVVLEHELEIELSSIKAAVSWGWKYYLSDTKHISGFEKYMPEKMSFNRFKIVLINLLNSIKGNEVS